ncbi:Vi polysaccharide transport protein VexE [Achromobacter seleniivolatilans]|uniref:Vi polysaccharide transport protein VexE n=1 Tax=Achromobacter seleniivolatilans TaxID=3047478 RepID=A0ABY9M289_9BURK|nr:Vi polysaccharide transport protein VexE [Achromobacter sp. R39]WMD20802.1 Vi polysaccharide transport protein VexE [Achromobacter sp. R39]
MPEVLTRAQTRRQVIAPLIKSGALEQAIDAAKEMLRLHPGNPDDHALLASLYGRRRLWEEAIHHADTGGAMADAAMGLHAARIRLRLQAGRHAEAAQVARDTLDLARQAPAESAAWITALLRTGDVDLAVSLVDGMEPGVYGDERSAALIVQALLAGGLNARAILAGLASLQAGLDGAALRSQLGQAYLARGLRDQGLEQALAHLQEGVRLAPQDVRLNSLYGETLLRAGRCQDAIPFLRLCSEREPALEHTRAMYARALRDSGLHTEAADQFLILCRQATQRGRWDRYAVSALLQAGRKTEAADLYRVSMQSRESQLPECFQLALAELDNRTDAAPIPQSRLDWAWSLRGAQVDLPRQQWERAVRWGHLVDHLMLDWLELRSNRAHEVMALLDNLDEVDEFLAPLIASGRGVVVATAHIGPMFAGPMIIELLGIRARWLASTPSVTQSAHAATLISTSDQSEVRVAKACFDALKQGCFVGVAVDGAANFSAPRILFEGQEITYSSFASRAAYRMQVSSIFYAPYWRNGRIALTLEHLPTVDAGEDSNAYARRWQRAYLEQVRKHLSGAPESLRASGGLWRHVR